MMPKILLVGEVLRHRSFNGANKALPTLASSLHSAGFSDVLQLDLERSDLTIDDVLVEATNADLVAFVGCMTPQWPELDGDTRQVSEHLRHSGRTEVPVLVGGYATKGVEDIARATPWVTAYFDGEGEEGIVAIARAVARGSFHEEMAQTKGLCFLNDGGRFVHSLAPRVGDLSAIDQNFGLVHVPAVHDMDIFVSADGRQLKTAQLFTQRGCPWACAFCNKSMETSTVTRVSEESIRQQLRQLRADGYEALYLDVDTFSVNQKTARREAEILREEGFIWGSNTRIDQIDLDTMQFMVEHNCAYMFFGVEHILPEVTFAIGKFNGSVRSQWRQARAYPAKIERVFRYMDAVGLPSSYFMILGLPKAVIADDGTEPIGYEPTTFEDDIAAVEFGLSRCKPDFLNFNMLRFMPGSIAADLPAHPAYTCVRPSGAMPITAGYFLPRVAVACGYSVPENHGVYRLCESVGPNQPTTTAVDTERVYDTIRHAIRLINAAIDAGGKATRLFIDHDIIEHGLVRLDDRGRYTLAPVHAFAGV